MKELIERLSSYHVFNYLLPGIVFSFFMEAFCKQAVAPKNNLTSDLFLFYFYGLVISRLGSVIIEPMLKWIGIIEFTPYEEFISAVTIDPKIRNISDINNMYRTFISTFIVLFLAFVYFQHFHNNQLVIIAIPYLCLVFLVLIFVLAYRKQTGFVKERINIIKKPQ